MQLFFGFNNFDILSFLTECVVNILQWERQGLQNCIVGYLEEQCRGCRHVRLPELRAQLIHRVVDITVQRYSRANLSAHSAIRAVKNGGRHLHKETTTIIIMTNFLYSTSSK